MPAMRAPFAFPLLLALGCATARPRVDATPAVQALRQGAFADAVRVSSDLLARGESPDARAVRAVATYRMAMHDLVNDVIGVVERAGPGGFDHTAMRGALERTLRTLDGVDADLAEAARDPAFALELCLACWQADWNHNGRVDERDQRLLEVEVDAKGERIPEGDPRRRPTFRFDVGDLHWGRAMIGFQRAALNLVLAYRWEEIDKLARRGGMPDAPTIRVRLEDPARVGKVKELLLGALGSSEASRQAYLAETDDDREWVPGPKQQSHPLPLPVDQALYDTWQGVVADLEGLVKGEQGLSVAEMVDLGDHKLGQRAPKGFVDVGSLLAKPKDIVFELRELFQARLDPERGLRSVLGSAYADKMTPSPLPARLARMRKEVERGEESFERKLRYLLWIN